MEGWGLPGNGHCGPERFPRAVTQKFWQDAAARRAGCGGDGLRQEGRDGAQPQRGGK